MYYATNKTTPANMALTAASNVDCCPQCTPKSNLRYRKFGRRPKRVKSVQTSTDNASIGDAHEKLRFLSGYTVAETNTAINHKFHTCQPPNNCGASTTD